MTAVVRPSMLMPVIVETRLQSSLSAWSSAPFSPPLRWTQYRKAMEELKKYTTPNNDSNASYSMFDGVLFLNRNTEEDVFVPVTPTPTEEDEEEDESDHDQETVAIVERVLSSILPSSGQDSLLEGSSAAQEQLPDGEGEFTNVSDTRKKKSGHNRSTQYQPKRQYNNYSRAKKSKRAVSPPQSKKQVPGTQ